MVLSTFANSFAVSVNSFLLDLTAFVTSELKKEGKVIKGTTEKNSEATLNTATKKVVQKLDKEVDKIEKTSKTEKQVEQKISSLVTKAVRSNKKLFTDTAKELAKVDKTNAKQYLMSLKKEIDTLLKKYEYGGMLPSNFGQAGLVGETGTMNEVDLFAMGGTLPQGVHQYYANTYNPAYPTPHGYAKGGFIVYGLRNDGTKALNQRAKTKEEAERIAKEIAKDYKQVANTKIEIFKGNYAKGGEVADLKKRVSELDPKENTRVGYDGMVSVFKNEYYWDDFEYGERRDGFKTEEDALQSLVEYLTNSADYYAKVGEIDTISELIKLYKVRKYEQYPYARDLVAHFIYGDDERGNLIVDATNGRYTKQLADYSELSDLMIQYENTWKDEGNMEYIDRQVRDYFSEIDIIDYYAKGGQIDENKAHYSINQDGQIYVDSNFINMSQNALPNSKLKHLGFGEFYLETPNGNVQFIRTDFKIKGFVGRTHRLGGNPNVGLDLLDAMKSKSQQVSGERFAKGGMTGNKNSQIIAEIEEIQSEITERPPKVYEREGQIKLSSEEGDEFSDYYGEFYEPMYVDARLEAIADKYNSYWDWENAGTLVLFQEFAKGGTVKHHLSKADSHLREAGTKLYENKNPKQDKFLKAKNKFDDSVDDIFTRRELSELGYAKGGGIRDYEPMSNEDYNELDKIKDWKIIKQKKHPSNNYDAVWTHSVAKNKDLYFGSGDFYRNALIIDGKVSYPIYFTKKDKAEKDFNSESFAKGGMMQGYNDKLDESLGNTKGKRSTKEQNYKDRRNESESMEKKGGKRKYARVKTMDKGTRKKRKTPMTLAKAIRRDGEKWQDAVKRATIMMKKEK